MAASKSRRRIAIPSERSSATRRAASAVYIVVVACSDVYSNGGQYDPRLVRFELDNTGRTAQEG
jgi:hypothetical protein